MRTWVSFAVVASAIIIITGECTFTYHGHRGVVNRLLCSGDLIFSSSYDTTARAWYGTTAPIPQTQCWRVGRMFDIGPAEKRTPSEACLRVFRGHLKGVYPMAFVPQELEENLPIGEDVQAR